MLEIINATLTLPATNSSNSLAGTSNIVIDTQEPSVSSVTISSNNANATKAKVGDVISVSITASESIQTPVVTIAGQSATVSGTGSTYTATYTVTSSTPEGAAAINVSYSDLAGNAGVQATATTNSSSVAIDYTTPTGYTFAINQANITQANQGATSITITSTEVGPTYSYTVSNGPSNISGTGTITSTTQTISNINVTSLADGLLTYSVWITDAAGNVGTAVTQTVSKDALPPTVSSVTSTSANGSYKAGNVIPIVVNFTEPVNVTGTPVLTLSAGGPASAAYASGSGTNVLTFNYTVASGQTASDLDYSSTSALTLNGGSSIQDAAGNSATLTLASPGAAGSLGNAKNLVVDTQVPTGYSTAFIPTIIDNSNVTNVSFRITGGEIGTTYAYTITKGTSSVNGTGTVTSNPQTISGINTSTVQDGTLTLSVTLSDVASNQGTASTATITKSTNRSPSGSVAPITLSQNDPITVVNLVHRLNGSRERFAKRRKCVSHLFHYTDFR